MDLYELVVPAMAALRVSPAALQVHRAASLVGRYYPDLSPDQPALIGPIEGAEQCRVLSARLGQVYPGEHQVTVLEGIDGPELAMADKTLADVAEWTPSCHPSLLYIPPLPCAGAVQTFQNTVAHLRAPDGCPWDREQTHRSLRQGFQEETYEVLDALDRGDLEALQEELGDVLLHILLQAQIASEQGEFRLSDVVCHVNRKIVYRHPHVFGELEVAGVAEVLVNWEMLKQQEKERRVEAPSPLDGIPQSLPALARAQSIQRHVDRTGALTEQVGDLVGEITSGVGRLSAAADPAEGARVLGQVLFALSDLARMLGIDAEGALREANARFEEHYRATDGAAPGDAAREAQGRGAGRDCG
jgi:tetrapyrrole methylase family protein/MazG family protein